MSHRIERRRRKKLRERREIPSDLHGSRHRDITLFSDARETGQDLRLVRRCVNESWDTPAEMRSWTIEKVMEIVRQTNGVDEHESDLNSLVACSVMYDMFIAARACGAG